MLVFLPHHVHSRGFVLLHTLWLLLAAATLIVGSMMAVFYSAEELTISERRLRADLAHESAVEMVIYDVLVKGNRSIWIGDGIVTRNVQISEQMFSVSVQQATGLIDAMTSDSRILSRLLAWLAIPRNSREPDFLSARSTGTLRPATYTDLQAMLGLSHSAFACLYPHITFYSGRVEPDWRYASNDLVELVGLRSRSAGTHSVLNDDTSSHNVTGATLRVNVLPGNTSDEAAGLSVEVTITGQIDPSHLIRSWKRITRMDNSKQCRNFNTN